MNKKIKVGVDVDGVLIDTDSKAFLRFCEEEMKWKVDYKIFEETHSWYKATGQATPEVIASAFTNFLQSVEDAQKPIAGAYEALKSISSIADIVLITARATTALVQITEEFIRSHLPDIKYSKIVSGKLENKADSIIEFGLHYFIDDSYREVSLVLQNKQIPTTVIPFPAFHSQPNWHELKDDRIYWLDVWKEVSDSVPVEKQVAIHKKAWEEIAELILN